MKTNESLIKSAAKFEFCLEGDNSIDAQLLSQIIMDLASLSKLTANNVDPDMFCKVNVEAFEKGSFNIVLATITEQVRNFFTNNKEVLTGAATIFTIIKGYFEVKKFLKGEAPKKTENIENDKIIIEKKNGDKIHVPIGVGLILIDPVIDNYVSGIATTVHKNNSKGGFSIKSDSEKFFYTAKDVLEIEKPLPITESVTHTVDIIETVLQIKKPDITGNSAWEFYLPNNQRIQASISDDDWLEKLHKRFFTIGYGDCINVRLEITRDQNPEIQIEAKEKYNVLEIIGDIIQEPPQETLY